MPKLLEQARDQLRTRHYSYRTEQTYLNWIKQFILFHGKRHPSLLGSDEIGAFLYPPRRPTHSFSLNPKPGAGGFALPLQAGAAH